MTYELDRRTRRDEDRRFITPAAFFAETFPGLAATHGHLVAEGMAALDAPPLTLEVEGAAWTLSRVGDTIEVRHGPADGALRIALTAEQFSDWAQNQITFNGFLVMRALQVLEGQIRDVSVWDSLWIALLEGWPVTDMRLAFRDRHGVPLDLAAAFAPDDDPADIAHFLREAGYLHLKGWLNPADLARISADMDRALPHYSEGDGKSWWATLKDGARCCVRLQDFVDHSPTTAAILSGPTWDRLRRIVAGQDVLAEVPVEGRVIEALFKPLGVASGPSDVSFHRDCHLGRHAYVCSRLTIGIPLTATPGDNGGLRVVAGSHRVAMPVEIAKTRPYLPVVALCAQAGDLTVHLSCTLHEATPPVFAERQVMYTEIPLAPRAGAVGPMDTSVGEIRDRMDDIHRAAAD
ncbi:phytanoyl-CoA dioxygenase family protein [Caulobacter soli]|uniref:phytanoyl-CoA dioxygenase family protein n=1 Tax=Caulobacter soli TaxID=2708539 RepID=UPI0013ED70C5|nr:phytanoyl-CoA dioxygenase family protein [Caulobacter soli]